MNKYILYGGGGLDHPEKRSFFREMTVGFNKKVRILLTYFARSPETFAASGQADSDAICRSAVTEEPEFMTAEVRSFAEQCRWADVIYLAGGETKKLYEELVKVPRLQDLFRNKVVAGSSAGAYITVKYYFSKDLHQTGEGLGFLPIKALCHYQEDDADVIKTLQNYREDLPLLVLPEYKWVVLYH